MSTVALPSPRSARTWSTVVIANSAGATHLPSFPTSQTHDFTKSTKTSTAYNSTGLYHSRCQHGWLFDCGFAPRASEDRVRIAHPLRRQSLIHRVRPASLDGVVVVAIGAERQKYHVHKALLVHHSKYFANALGGAWREGKEGLVTLEDVEPAICKCLCPWFLLQYQLFLFPPYMLC